VLYDLERLKLRIYGRRGVVQKMRSIYSTLLDLFDVNSVVGGRETRSRSLALGGENRNTFSRVKADGNTF
jgi:hypothetical protein